METIGLGDALEIVRELEPLLLAVGYHCGLTGGVLQRSMSQRGGQAERVFGFADLGCRSLRE